MMRFLKNLLNSHRTHKTPNTEKLTEKFDSSLDFQVQATLGKAQWEGLGAMLLGLAKKKGRFVAVPTSSKRYFPIYTSSFVAPSAKYIPEMVQDGYLVVEKVGDLEVVSPSEKMAYRMYGRDRAGNRPKLRQFTQDEIRSLNLRNLVRLKYVD